MEANSLNYQLFGSGDSKDYDIMVFIDEIPETIDHCHSLCKEFKAALAEIYKDKPVNSNLAVIENGQVVKVFKGWPDEVNNALFYTYDLHPQKSERRISGPVERDIDQKLLRACRSILSFFTKSHLRPQIKNALRGDLRLKLEALKEIDFTKLVSFPDTTEEQTKDIYKVIAFQLTQLFSLADGFEKESYTKSGLIKHFPELEPLLSRKSHSQAEMKILNEYKKRLISLAEERIGNMKKLVE